MNSAAAMQKPYGDVDIDTLADIQDVVIDTSLPLEERRKSYLRQIRDPRLYRCDDTVVRLSFADNGSSLKDRLKQYLLSGQGMKL